MIKPSTTEVQNIARVATQAIEDDLKIFKESENELPITEYDIIQLHIERLITLVIKGFETELTK